MINDWVLKPGHGARLFFFFLAFIFALRYEVYNLHEYVKKRKKKLVMYLIAIAPSHAFFHFLHVIDTL